MAQPAAEAVLLAEREGGQEGRERRESREEGRERKGEVCAELEATPRGCGCYSN